MFDDKSIPEKTRETVRILARRQRLPQSILLTGGSEKLREKCAKELCFSALCEQPGEKGFCGRCPACVRAKAGTHPDVIELKPEKDKKSVSVKEVRERVLADLSAAPNFGDVKLYLFYAAENLSDVIQNALLKTIEEPPAHVMFVFLCDQREHLLETVISRVTEFYLGDIPGGAKRDSAPETAAALVKALSRNSPFHVLLATAPMVKNRKLMRRTAQEIILLVRDALVIRDGIAPLSESADAAGILRETLDNAQLMQLKEEMEAIVSFADANANENLLISRFSYALDRIKKS